MIQTIQNIKGRVFAIGDLHGCYEEAAEMMELLSPSRYDIVIFVGDLVDRGPDNDKCVDLAMQHRCVLGNHEFEHLAYAFDGKTCKKDAHVRTRVQLRPEHYHYFRSLPHIIRLPQFGAAVVHAGVYPGTPLEDQPRARLRNLQNICPPDPRSKWPSKSPEGWQFWTNFYKGPETVVFGHTVLNEPLVTEHAIGIDGGCVFGGELWAVELPSRQIHRVKSRGEQYRGVRRGEWPEKGFAVHDDIITPS